MYGGLPGTAAAPGILVNCFDLLSYEGVLDQSFTVLVNRCLYVTDICRFLARSNQLM